MGRLKTLHNFCGLAMLVVTAGCSDANDGSGADAFDLCAVLDCADSAPADTVERDAAGQDTAVGADAESDLSDDVDVDVTGDVADLGTTDGVDDTERNDALDAEDASGTGSDVLDAGRDARDDPPVDAGVETSPDTEPDGAGDVSDAADAEPDVDVAVDADAGADVESDTDVDDDSGTPDRELRIVWVDDPVLAAHQVVTPDVERRRLDYGYGLAPLDADGDGDLDLFIGTLPDSEQPACVYENVSTPGAPAFAVREEWCGNDGLGPVSAVAMDVDGDGREELIAQSEGSTYYIDLDEGWSLDRRFPEPTDCTPGPIALVDDDLDGRSEVVVACMPDLGIAGGVLSGPSRTLLVSESGLREVDRPAYAVEDSRTLGIGTLDGNDDGLLDVMFVTDTLGTWMTYNPNVTPTQFVQREIVELRKPGSSVNVGEDQYAWGSHMGFEVFPFQEELIYLLTDRTVPLPKTYGDATFPIDRRLVLPPQPFAAEYPHDSWSILSSDWNGDGHIDLFMTFGRAAPGGTSRPATERNAFLLSSRDGTLTYDRERLLMRDPNAFPDPVYGSAQSSRGAIRVDFDADGVEEIVIANVNGVPEMFRIEGARPRCTIRPVPRYVDTPGGYALERELDAWVPVNVGGELLTFDGRHILTERRSGRVRFPSGYVSSYDCGAGYVTTVTEPEWIEVAFDDSAVRVRLAALGPDVSVELAVRDGADVTTGAVSADDEGVRVLAGTFESPEVFVQIDGRWTPRWFVASR